MTELLEGVLEVRAGRAGLPEAMRLDATWHDVLEVAGTWRVETGWWQRTPVRRDYIRCLLAGGECIDVYRDLDTGEWHLVRRHD